jgi:hypothetical protein
MRESGNLVNRNPWLYHHPPWYEDAMNPIHSKVVWSRRELSALRRLSTPDRVQSHLDQMAYRCESVYVPPIISFRENRAHCFDGALLAATALHTTSHSPRLIDLCATDDDDHVLCAYRYKGHWGAVAKSNFPGLRFREPIFRSVRELVLSYFENYFNLDGLKSLRRYSRPVILPDVDKLLWQTTHVGAERIVGVLEGAKHYDILAPRMSVKLRKVDSRFYASQMVGVDLKGAYKGSR